MECDSGLAMAESASDCDSEWDWRWPESNSDSESERATLIYDSHYESLTVDWYVRYFNVMIVMIIIMITIDNVYRL